MFNIIKVFSEKHPARAGTLAGIFQQGCGVFAALLLVAAASAHLEPSLAGTWFAFQGLATAMALLDFGFGFALSRQISHALGSADGKIASDDFAPLASESISVSHLLSFSNVFYRWMALAITLIGFGLFEILDRFANFIPTDSIDARICWYFMITGSAFLSLAGGLTSFANGTGAIYQSRFAYGIYLLGSGAGAALSATMNWGLPMMGASFAFFSFIYWVLMGLLYNKMGNALVKTKEASQYSLVLRLFKVALPLGVVNFFGNLVFYIQPTLIGSLFGADKVASYFLAQRLAFSFSQIPFHFVTPQLPLFTTQIAAQDTRASDRMKKTILIGSALVIICSISFFILSPVFAFFLLKEIDFINSTTRFLMSLDMLLAGCSVLWGHFVLASGKNPFLTSTIAFAFTSIIGIFLFNEYFGISALPLSTMLAGLFFIYRKNFIEGLKTLRVISNVRI